MAEKAAVTYSEVLSKHSPGGNLRSKLPSCESHCFTAVLPQSIYEYIDIAQGVISKKKISPSYQRFAI